MKSFKHEHLFYLHLYMSSQHNIVMLTAQTDFSLRSRTFSLKINWLHFLKSLKRDNV